MSPLPARGGEPGDASPGAPQGPDEGELAQVAVPAKDRTGPGRAGSSILVVGNSAVDLIARTIDEAPPPGGMRKFGTYRLASGGCAVNVATALARLGVAVDVATRVGDDRFGDFLVSELRQCGVGTDILVPDAAALTPFTFAAVRNDGERSFYHCPGSNDRLTRTDVPDVALKERRFVMVTGAMLMATLDGEETADLLRIARVGGATTLLDTSLADDVPRERWLAAIVPALRHTDLFVPSIAEARILAGEEEPSQITAALQKHGAHTIVMKMDARGALIRERDGNESHVPAFPVDNVVDSTGAGDCFCAGLLAGLSAGKSVRDAALLGNAVAAHGIQRAGATTGVPRLDEIARFMNDADHS